MKLRVPKRIETRTEENTPPGTWIGIAFPVVTGCGIPQVAK
jgi:hypothetical protein